MAMQDLLQKLPFTSKFISYHPDKLPQAYQQSKNIDSISSMRCSADILCDLGLASIG
uniref:Uncharacterized protein n=1 Tax=Arundo donax TaxID=35708 RepID=A0A0A9AGC6_ARUDO